MRLFGYVCLLAAIGFCSPVLAMSESEICAQIMREYGVRADQCADAPTAPPQRVVSTELSADILESHIFFAKGGTALDGDARLQLAALAAVLNAAPMQTACLRLIGHSDTSGGATANQALALKRAEVVAASLRASMADGSRIKEVVSMGETQPLDSLPGSSPLNRRVEIRAKTCP
ncbi:OmpA family protein [Shimia sp.]|uniref:OmpA family protein n=1 Tax=Shimia sp. TaxID=1954381 RepID=UPI003BAD4284